MSAPTTNIPFSNPLYRNHNFYRRYGKRALDFTGALFGLICLFPVLAILAILLAIVQRTSPFFLQKRIGHGLKPFHIIKFKTMKDTRDKEGNLLPDEERTTVLGSLLRSTSLDELPELINVLLGDMSFIGPRPWIPDQMAIFTPSTRKKRMSLRHALSASTIRADAGAWFSPSLTASEYPARTYAAYARDWRTLQKKII